MNNRGYNFLHSAIKRLDMENVLFLIDVKVSMNSRTRDQHRYTPLHLAVLAGSELIVRNLVSFSMFWLNWSISIQKLQVWIAFVSRSFGRITCTFMA